ncbi:Polyketide cyclase [Cryptosporidium meleagridis]
MLTKKLSCNFFNQLKSLRGICIFERWVHYSVPELNSSVIHVKI